MNMSRGKGARKSFAPPPSRGFRFDLLSGESYSVPALTDVSGILSGSDAISFWNRLRPDVPPPCLMTLLDFGSRVIRKSNIEPVFQQAQLMSIPI